MFVLDTTGLAHPRSQDSLLPICHLLINTETVWVKWLLEKCQYVHYVISEQQASGQP